MKVLVRIVNHHWCFPNVSDSDSDLPNAQIVILVDVCLQDCMHANREMCQICVVPVVYFMPATSQNGDLCFF